MKKSLVVLLVLLGGFWGATNQSRLKSWWEDIEHRVERFLGHEEFATTDSTPQEPEHAPEPAPVVQELPPAPPPTTPTPPPTFGEGIFYTRERISQTTDAGVKSIAALVKVTKVGEVEGKLLVDDGRNRVLTERSKLTNDPMELAALQQAAVPPLASKSKNVIGSTGSVSSRMDTAARAKNQTQIRVMQAQVTEIDRQIWGLKNEVSRLSAQSLDARARGRPSTYNDRAISDLNTRISTLQAQRASLMQSMAAIPR